MGKYKVGILRVLTTEDTEKLLSHQKILARYFPEFEMETKCIPNKYNGLFNEEAYNEAVPEIIRMAKKWERDLDGLIISCADDPGVDYLQHELSIPVVGAGTSVACLGMNLSNKIGIIGIKENPPKNITDILGDRIVGYELPKDVKNTNDLLTDWGRDATLKSAYNLKRLGAKVIIFACTGFSTAGAYKFINEVGVAIVDGVLAEGIVMNGLLINKSFNNRL